MIQTKLRPTFGPKSELLEVTEQSIAKSTLAAKRANFGTAVNNIEINTHAACCASTAVHLPPHPFSSGRFSNGSACPAGLAFMGVARELRPGNFSTSAVEQPEWALV